MACTEKIIVFDGLCNFCNGWVRFVARRDSRSPFLFAQAQSATGASLLHAAGLPGNSLQTILLAAGERYYVKSDAVIEIVRSLGGAWRIATAARILPRRVRDAIYDWVARNRYLIAGKRPVCELPTDSLRRRFLD